MRSKIVDSKKSFANITSGVSMHATCTYQEQKAEAFVGSVKRFSFSKECAVFSCMFGVFSLLICTALIIFVVVCQQNKLQDNLTTEGNFIHGVIKSTFDEYHFKLLKAGKEITKKKLFGAPTMIAKELESIQLESNKESSFGLSWVARDLSTTVSQYGQLLALEQFDSSYVNDLKRNTGKLQVSSTNVDKHLPTKVINMGIGFKDGSYNFLGFINARINISTLLAGVNPRLQNKDMNFLLLEDDFSSGFSVTPSENILVSLDHNSLSKIAACYALSNIMTCEHYSYLYTRKIDGYPYMILAGYPKYYTFKHIKWTLISIILGVMGIALVFPVFLHFFSRKALQKVGRTYTKEIEALEFDKDRLSHLEKYAHIVKESEAHQNDFIEQIKSKVFSHLAETIKSRETLPEKVTDLSKEKEALNIRKALIENVQDDTIDLSAIRISLQKLAWVDLGKVIEDSTKIHSKLAHENEIKIKTETPHESLTIFTDELCFKQLIVSLLATAIEGTPKKGTILVNVLDNPSKGGVNIEIKDNGFGLDDEKLTQYSEAEPGTIFDSLWSLSLDRESIKTLVSFLQGSISLETVLRKGRTVKLFFPCEVQTEEPVSKESKNNNVVKIY